ncbi:MAG: YbaK/EbsC family protein, partial [Thermoanaerobaculia bacterium]|nr:YbaK/EbsC family protein [Thermoanaerobaculia bacterium]
AQEVAASAHIPGKEMAKSVIVKTPDGMAMVVLPAVNKVSLEKVREVMGTGDVELAEESEFIDLFPGCVPGAMPPFGNLYGVDVYVEPALAEDEEIAFNAGTHTDLIRMRYEDFERLVKPKVVKIAR